MTGWGTPREVAVYVGRPMRTVRNWATTGQVPSACDLRTKRLVVHAASTRIYADTRGRKLRQPAA